MKSRNLNSYIVQFTSPRVADTEFAVPHECGEVPKGAFILAQTKSGTLYRSGTLAPAGGLATNFNAGWEFEDNTNLGLDGSGNGLTLTNSSATRGTGKVGFGANFVSTSSQYLYRASEAALNIGSSAFAFTFWAYFTSLAASKSLVTKWTGGGQAVYACDYNATTSRLRFYVTANGTAATVVSATSFGAPSTGNWYFIYCGLNKSTNLIKISVNDGTVDSTAFATSVFDGTAQFCIGRRAIPDGYMDGYIDQVMFWKRDLTAAEITQLYNSGNGLSIASAIPSPTWNETAWDSTNAYFMSSSASAFYTVMFFV